MSKYVNGLEGEKTKKPVDVRLSSILNVRLSNTYPFIQVNI